MRMITQERLLIAAAVIPALVLFVKIYQADRLEKEPIGLLVLLAATGLLTTVIAGLIESLGIGILNRVFHPNTLLYQVLEYFLVVALTEEGIKLLFLRKLTWRSPHFNCRFDGLVYAVFVSLGFALFENISYVLSYGMITALLRAISAVPGHACFAVFMGCFYGMERQYENMGHRGKARQCRRLELLVPVLLHGTYDLIASGDWLIVTFVLFVAGMFLATLRMVRKAAKEDQYIDRTDFRVL